MALRPKGSLVKRLRSGEYIPAKDKREGTFYFGFSINGKRRLVSCHTNDLAVAKEFAARLKGPTSLTDHRAQLAGLVALGEWARGELGETRYAPGRPTLSGAWESWLASRRRPTPGELQLRIYAGWWQKFINWIPSGVKYLDDIQPGHAEAFLTHLEGTGEKFSTIKQKIQTLRMIHRVLLPNAPNPWVGLRPHVSSSVEHYRRLTPAECAAILAAAADEWRMLVAIGYYTGLRLKDAACLDWTAVDMSARVIRLTPAKTSKRGKTIEIPVLPGLYKVIETSPGPRAGPVLPAIQRLYRRDQSAVSSKLSEIFASAGVKSNKEGHASFHSFRATLQSMLDAGAVHRTITRSVLGHQSSAMSDTYSTLDVEGARKAMAGAVPEL